MNIALFIWTIGDAISALIFISLVVSMLVMHWAGWRKRK